MLTVPEAKKLLFDKIKELPSSKKDVAECLGYVLAENVYAPLDSPVFTNSAVDGFAVCVDFESMKEKNISLAIAGEIKAGDKPLLKLKRNSAVRILTGAAVPQNAVCVVMQENTEVVNGHVIIPSFVLIRGNHIRPKGSQMKKGELALRKGTKLNPGTIGFLCSMGFSEIKVVKKPVVSILSTGNELRQPGDKLMPGQIYESNSGMLNAALKETGFISLHVKSVADNEKLIRSNVVKMLNSSDVVIISGGISVGKYDLVRKVLIELGVKEIFYKVSQKPGKPLFAGMVKNKPVFALPGNPAASLVCFYEYVLPSLEKMSGCTGYGLKKEFMPLAETFKLKSDRDLFLKANVENGMVYILEGQESNILKSFALTNALVYLSSGKMTIRKGTKVETHLLP